MKLQFGHMTVPRWCSEDSTNANVVTRGWLNKINKQKFYTCKSESLMFWNRHVYLCKLLQCQLYQYCVWAFIINIHFNFLHSVTVSVALYFTVQLVFLAKQKHKSPEIHELAEKGKHEVKHFVGCNNKMII